MRDTTGRLKREPDAMAQELAEWRSGRRRVFWRTRVGDTVTNYVYRRDAQFDQDLYIACKVRRVTVGPAKNAKKKKEAG